MGLSLVRRPKTGRIASVSVRWTAATRKPNSGGPQMKPGRKSSYDLLAPMIPGQSPPPPEELEPDQQLEWEAITARLPADWFSGENIPMLKELCRHITYARE